MTYSRGTNGEKLWDTETTSVIEWLESPEGQEWSRKKHEHARLDFQLVTIKNDMDVVNNVTDIDVLLWYA